MVDIIGYTHTRYLGNKMIPKTYMNEKLIKINENNSKKEGEIIIIRKTLEINVWDEKLINHNMYINKSESTQKQKNQRTW